MAAGGRDDEGEKAERLELPGPTSLATVATGLAKRYGRRRPWVLDHVDLRLEPHTLTLVIGANGSGKSTLLRVLAGVSRQTAGRVAQRPQRVGYVPERPPSSMRMTGREYLGHMARLHRLDAANARSLTGSLAQSFDISPGLDVAIASLSKGNRQKILLVQALLAHRGLLLLDEPRNGLDPAATNALQDELLKAQRDGATVLVTAHATGYGLSPDRTLVLSKGRLIDAELAPRSPVLVELSPPSVGCQGQALPDWTGTSAELRGHQLVRLSVEADKVGPLLARALSEGWSVHRVDPGRAGPQVSPGPVAPWSGT
jgi:ABC-type Mn2+/Zn2+ transport system ATPase subunit